MCVELHDLAESSSSEFNTSTTAVRTSIGPAIYYYVTGDHIKQDLRCTQKPTRYIFSYFYYYGGP